MKFAALALLCAATAFSFELRTFQEQVPESNPITCTRVVDGKTVFSFATPLGWMMRSDAEAKRILLYTGNKATIAIQISTNAMPKKISELKRAASNRFEGAVILDEFEASSGAEPGFGVDVRHTMNGNIAMITRWCVYKAADSTVEVLRTCRPDDVQETHPAWTSFINSLRVEQRPRATALALP